MVVAMCAVKLHCNVDGDSNKMGEDLIWFRVRSLFSPNVDGPFFFVGGAAGFYNRLG